MLTTTTTNKSDSEDDLQTDKLRTKNQDCAMKTTMSKTNEDQLVVVVVAVAVEVVVACSAQEPW